MSDLSSRLKLAKETGDYSPLLKAIPYAQFLNLSIFEAEGGLITQMTFAENQIGNPLLPALHGGTVGALLESAAIFTLMTESDAEQVPKIISLSVDYLRSGKPQDTFAQATLTRLGRRVANVRVEAWQEDKTRPIAAAHALFLL